MRIFTLIFLALFSLSVSANTESYVSPKSISVSGEGRGGDRYSLKFLFKPSTKGAALRELRLSMVYGSFVSGKAQIANIYDPEISKIQVKNDSGVYGSSYTFTVPYGKSLSCNKKMILEITQPFDKEASNLILRKIDPCNENS